MLTILEKIRKKYKSLSPSHKKVAEYISDHLEEAFIFNATQLANKIDVSESTITRFITTLGFSGFSEFKRELGQFVIKGYSTTEKLTESAESFGDSNSVFSEILRGDIENIRTSATQIPTELFEETIKRISSARSIYILGLRTSYTLALYLAFNFKFFLRSVNLIKPEMWDIPEQVLDCGSKDVLISISFRRYTREVVNLTEKISKRGTFVIAITNSSLAPIAQLADIALIVTTEIHTYIESYTAPMSVLNAIITAIALKKKNRALPVLNKLEKAFQEFETYSK